jgi:hypothetical protein
MRVMDVVKIGRKLEIARKLSTAAPLSRPMKECNTTWRGARRHEGTKNKGGQGCGSGAMCWCIDVLRERVFTNKLSTRRASVLEVGWSGAAVQPESSKARREKMKKIEGKRVISVIFENVWAPK